MPDTFVHFEIPASDPDKLMKFYSSAFGWKFQRTPMPGLPGGEYILIETVEQGKPGMNGGMYKRASKEEKARNFIGVANIDSTLRKIATLGGKLVQPKMAVPGIGWAAFVTDPEGNVQGIFQDDKGAK